MALRLDQPAPDQRRLPKAHRDLFSTTGVQNVTDGSPPQATTQPVGMGDLIPQVPRRDIGPERPSGDVSISPGLPQLGGGQSPSLPTPERPEPARTPGFGMLDETHQRPTNLPTPRGTTISEGRENPGGISLTPERTVRPEETTAGQLRDLISENSPYIRQARERAMQTAGSRGLQNTSIAAQAGEQAAISAALPIASETAAAHERAALSGQEFQQGQALSAQNSMQQLAQMAESGDIQSRHMLEQFGYNFELSAQDNFNRLQQLAMQGDVNARLALQQFGFSRALQYQSGQISSSLQNQRHIETLAEQANAGDIEAQRMLQQFGYTGQLSAQEHLQQLETLAMQGDVNAALQLQQFNFQTLLADQAQGHAIALEDVRLQSQIAVLGEQFSNALGLNEQETGLWVQRQNLLHEQTLEQIGAQAQATGDLRAQEASLQVQGQYLTNVAQRQMLASQEIAQIYQTEGLDAAQQRNAVRAALNRLNADLSALQAYYAQSPLWDVNWALPIGGGGEPGLPGSPGTPANPAPASPPPGNLLPPAPGGRTTTTEPSGPGTPRRPGIELLPP